MELVIKIIGERIKLGVLYPERSDAERRYNSFKKESIKKYFIATIEVHDNYLNLALTNSNGDIIEYHNLKYSGNELMKLRSLMRPNAQILFAHIYRCPVRGLIAVPAKWRSEFVKINYHHIVIVRRITDF